MAAELSVNLDRPYDYYTEGDKVTGHVLVRVDKPDVINKLRVQHYWRADVVGQVPKHGVANLLKLDDKKLEAGREYKFKFAFPTERTPVTHRGSTLEVSWLVGAQAQLAGQGKLRDDTEYVQISGKREKHKKGKPLMAGESKLSFGSRRFKGRCYTNCNLRPSRVKPGQTAISTISLRPKAEEAAFNKVLASLVCVETNVTGKKKSPKVDVKRTVTDTVEFTEAARAVAPGEEVELECLFKVPESAQASSSTKRKKIEWIVELEIDAVSGPDLTEGFPLVVLDATSA